MKIGISIGDLNGIGGEIILKTFADDRMYKHCTPIVFGSEKALKRHAELLELSTNNFKTINNIEEAQEGKLNIFNCWQENISINLGKEDKALGKYALKALDEVAKAAIDKKIDAIVTAPVSKELINTPEQKFVGQTEFFTQKSGASESLMLMASESLKVGLVTNHLPVAEVAKAINKNGIIRKLLTLNKGLKTAYGIEKPKIAVLSLNPHAGDGGLIGNEEKEIILPALNEAKKEGVLAIGPYPADAFFGNGNHKNFDAVLAMFHDQGLVPFKALSFGNGTNVTLGLPIVRTSPDHGPAFDIAGKNMANFNSLRQAIFTATDIARHRNTFKEIHKNPIKKLSIDDLKKLQKEDSRY